MNAIAPPKTESARTNPTMLLLVVCLAQFMVILDISIVNVALPSIQASLHFATTGLQWVVNAYTLTFGGFLMLGGRAADLLGRRSVFLVGIALFMLSSLACALALARADDRRPHGAGHLRRGISPASLAILTPRSPRAASATARSGCGARSAASAPRRASSSAAC